MLLELADLLRNWYSGFHLFQYLTFRAIMSTLTALAVSLLIGPAVIRKLADVKAGQVIRSDGPQTHLVKAGTPTMGGLLIILAVAVATLLWMDLHNRYVWMVLGVTLAFGGIGFYDDYKKPLEIFLAILVWPDRRGDSLYARGLARTHRALSSCVQDDCDSTGHSFCAAGLLDDRRLLECGESHRRP